MRFAVDSNVLIYSIGLDEEGERERAIRLLEALPADDLVVPLQVIGEATRWACTKGKKSRAFAAEQASRWLATYMTQDTNRSVVNAAFELLAKHKFQIWDAIILSAAAEAKAGVLLSGDMQDGFRWRGVTVMNPFATRPALPIRQLLSIA